MQPLQGKVLCLSHPWELLQCSLDCVCVSDFDILSSNEKWRGQKLLSYNFLGRSRYHKANLSPNYIISCKQIDSIINLGQLMMTKKTAHWITAARNLKSTKVNYFRSLALFWYDDSAAAQYNDGDKNAHASFFVCSSGCVPPHCQITLKCTKEVKLFLIDMISTSRKSHESRSLSWFGFCFDYIGSWFQRVKRRSATSGFPQRRSRPQKISLHGQVTWIVTFSASNHQSVWLCSEICS